MLIISKTVYGSIYLIQVHRLDKQIAIIHTKDANELSSQFLIASWRMHCALFFSEGLK